MNVETTAAPPYRTERYDAISTRILCSGGWVVAMIEQLTNGRWVISVGDRRYTPLTFASVRAAFKWWQERQAEIASR